MLQLIVLHHVAPIITMLDLIIILLHLMLHLPLLQHLIVPYHLAAPTNVAPSCTSPSPSCCISLLHNDCLLSHVPHSTKHHILSISMCLQYNSYHHVLAAPYCCCCPIVPLLHNVIVVLFISISLNFPINVVPTCCYPIEYCFTMLLSQL